MWRCKECRSDNITKHCSGDAKWENYIFNKKGIATDPPELVDYRSYYITYSCNGCGNEGDKISDIAEWVEK